MAKHTDASFTYTASARASIYGPQKPRCKSPHFNRIFKDVYGEGSASLSDGYQGVHLIAEKSNIDQGATQATALKNA